MNPTDRASALFLLLEDVRAALTRSDDLRRAPWRGSANPYAGHCYVASEALRFLAAQQGIALKVMHVRWEGAPHWYLETEDGLIVDPTGDQFAQPVDYSLGKGKGFLTAQPSARARALLARLPR